MSMMESLFNILFSLCCGFGTGTLSGLLGIGGGMIMVPLFCLVFNMSPLSATATSLFVIILTSVFGTITHLYHKTCLLRIGLITGLSGAPVAFFSARIARYTPNWLIVLVTALIIMYSAIHMLKGTDIFGKYTENNKHSHIKQTSSWQHMSSLRTAVLSSIIGLIAGFFSGFSGVGGGFIMVPFFVNFLQMDMKMTSGTSLLAILFIAVTGSIQRALFGHIAFLPGLNMGIAAIPGAILGSHLVRKVPERTLKIVFSCLLIICAIMLIGKQVIH
ncbi:unnamed protein product [Cylicostephanus goldi]|uniref:Membrane transporter protein n=1 Tax=Cylicostephanus goldi TaxID=71465 RepID=A0A3P6TZF0_CYLGO|nr:unnamed protein product [Cylicostephanus goldi]